MMQKQLSKPTAFLSALFGLCLIVFLLISNIKIAVFDKGFYQNLYDDLQIETMSGASRSDIEKSLFAMIDYVQGNRDDLNETITWHGQVQEAFNPKEIAHMKDVKALYKGADQVGWICLGICFGIGFYFVGKKKEKGVESLCQGYLAAVLSFILFLLVLGMWIAIDFTSFWISFHHLFFTNELWALNPLTDFMIVICPESMFSSLIGRILIPFVIELLALGGLAYIRLKRKRPINEGVGFHPFKQHIE